MDCGKSTLALQLRHNFLRSGRAALLMTVGDREDGVVSSRVGLSAPALFAGADMNLFEELVNRRDAGERVDDVIIDEAQFLSDKQVDQLGSVVDDLDINVHAFGIRADFLGDLFPGTRRLFEIADESIELQVESLCWCGSKGVFNARVIDGHVARTGPQVMLGDTDAAAEIYYVVLCRKHYNSGALACPAPRLM